MADNTGKLMPPPQTQSVSPPEDQLFQEAVAGVIADSKNSARDRLPIGAIPDHEDGDGSGTRGSCFHPHLRPDLGRTRLAPSSVAFGIASLKDGLQLTNVGQIWAGFDRNQFWLELDLDRMCVAIGRKRGEISGPENDCTTQCVCSV